MVEREAREARLVEHEGETRPLGEWVARLGAKGVTVEVVERRMAVGWSLERALDAALRSYTVERLEEQERRG